MFSSRGVPLKVILELMGHAAIEMTLKYAHLSPETRRVAVLVLDEAGTGLDRPPARHTDGTREVDPAKMSQLQEKNLEAAGIERPIGHASACPGVAKHTDFRRVGQESHTDCPRGERLSLAILAKPWAKTQTDL